MARVLIVDDDPAILQLVALNLELEGYDVLRATSGPEALEIARDRAPQMIVLDVMMPGMDGYAVCEALRESEATGGVPVLMLSARTSASDQQRALDAGAVGYVTRPFDPSDLIAIIERHLA